jgi:uncharacterized tellurite resistance protein B-like protein
VPVRTAVARVGTTVAVRYAAGVLKSLPATLRDATRNPFDATALLCAMILGTHEETRLRQLGLLRGHDAALAGRAERLAGEIARADREARLPLLSIAMPALRTLSHDQWRRYSALLDELVACDGQMDLFEFVLKKMVARQLDAFWEPRRAMVVEFYSFSPLANDCSVLLSALASCAADDAATCTDAFQRAAARLPFPAGLPRRAASDCSVSDIDAALTRLGRAVPYIKKTVLEACAECVAADGYINAYEAELLRAIADALECPLPPMVEGV